MGGNFSGSECDSNCLENADSDSAERSCNDRIGTGGKSVVKGGWRLHVR